MFSDVSAWFYCGLAGISPDPAEPGFKHVLLSPSPVRALKWVRAHHDSPYGRLRCDWKAEGGAFELHVEIPANTHASLSWPAGYPEPASLPEGVRRNGADKLGRVLLEVPSGIWDLRSA
jgi:alpha-L-rhamnosidase